MKRSFPERYAHRWRAAGRGLAYRSVSVVFVVLALAASVSTTSYAQQGSALLGDWTGESICVGEVGACHDEQVVYHFAVSKSDAQKLTLSADKIVNGKPEPMGDIDFAYDAANHILTGEFQNPRTHILIQLTVKGNMMWGTMLHLPDHLVVRQIRVTKSDSNQTNSKMSEHVNGTFEVKLAPQDDKSDDKSMGRMTIEKQWQGGLEGTSKGQMLTGGDVAKGSGAYVAIEKFTGTVGGRKGTLIFQHLGVMNRGATDLTITVVPDSGTDQLQGINGKLTIKMEGGKHLYDFEYTIK
jgi:hypothetical protein